MSSEGDPLLYQIGGAIGSLLVGGLAAIIGLRKGRKAGPTDSERHDAEAEDRAKTQADQDTLRRLQAELDTEKLLVKVSDEFEAVRTEFRLVTESLKEMLHGRMASLAKDVKGDVAELRADVHKLDVTVAGLKGRIMKED